MLHDLLACDPCFDPQAWLADVLARIADHKITDLAALLPWNWHRAIPADRAA